MKALHAKYTADEFVPQAVPTTFGRDVEITGIELLKSHARALDRLRIINLAGEEVTYVPDNELA